MNEVEKQLTPLKGEVTPEDARVKATAFASQIKTRLKNKGAKLN
jgi:hypothetical protein